jgi:hypothetical protein
MSVLVYARTVALNGFDTLEGAVGWSEFVAPKVKAVAALRSATAVHNLAEFWKGFALSVWMFCLWSPRG